MPDIQELKDEYRRLMHAMQTGIAYVQEYDDSESSPKHLRVGINSALIESSALGKLLMNKKIITEEEYLTSIINLLKKEVEDYTRRLRNVYGVDITLG